MKALSIKQPWADRILFEGKDYENRTWPTKYRGWCAVHAGKTPDEPDVEKHRLGGIVGFMRIDDCVQSWEFSDVAFAPRERSDWFNGPYGFKIGKAIPIVRMMTENAHQPHIISCKGALGFFDPTKEMNRGEKLLYGSLCQKVINYGDCLNVGKLVI